MTGKSLSELQNIGKTLESRLHEIGIRSDVELKSVGAVKAYKWLAGKYPEKHLPVCYYLYSLEGAIQDKHWKEFTGNEKLMLRLAAGLSK